MLTRNTVFAGLLRILTLHYKWRLSKKGKETNCKHQDPTRIGILLKVSYRVLLTRHLNSQNQQNLLFHHRHHPLRYYISHWLVGLRSDCPDSEGLTSSGCICFLLPVQGSKVELLLQDLSIFCYCLNTCVKNDQGQVFCYETLPTEKNWMKPIIEEDPPNA